MMLKTTTGIPEEAKEKVMTGLHDQGSGHGTGLGMSISNKIIQGHAGELQLLDSVELGGACVRMILPSVQMNASQEKSGYTVDGSGETADESATGVAL